MICAPAARMKFMAKSVYEPCGVRVNDRYLLLIFLAQLPIAVGLVLESLGLAEKRNTRFGKLSGGQKQRLSIALALVGNPEVAILDELTTGLDPNARRETWDFIEGIRERGVTVILCPLPAGDGLGHAIRDRLEKAAKPK